MQRLFYKNDMQTRQISGAAEALFEVGSYWFLQIR